MWTFAVENNSDFPSGSVEEWRILKHATKIHVHFTSVTKVYHNFMERVHSKSMNLWKLTINSKSTYITHNNLVYSSTFAKYL